MYDFHVYSVHVPHRPL